MKRVLVNRRQFMIVGAAFLATTNQTLSQSRMVRIMIEDLAFKPAQIQVKAGDVIEWVNNDPFDHTATVKGGWEVIIPAGESATKTITASDNVDYYCRFHPNMTGRIVVTG